MFAGLFVDLEFLDLSVTLNCRLGGSPIVFLAK
jgi:hypothetical protein